MSMDIDGTYDDQGWQYSVDFKGPFGGKNDYGKYVRRRKWVRIQLKKSKSGVDLTSPIKFDIDQPLQMTD